MKSNNKRQLVYHLILSSLWLSVILLGSCEPKSETGSPLEGRPNILWLVAEDLSPYIPSFGDSTVETPNLSRLAAEGVRYTQVFSVSGVCSPSRACLITGMYPSSIGAHHMRTLHQQPAAKAMGLINYEVVPPSEVKMVSEIMRENGYYTSNNAKEDYQFRKSLMAWDESSIYAHWRNRPEGMPFFSVFNFEVTHESNMWNPFGRTYDLDTFPPPRSEKSWWKQFEDAKKPLYVDKDLAVNVPPYLPETALVIQDMRRMYSNIVEMDKHVGIVLDQLEADGLLDNTIVVWYTDHGGPLPRQKRLLYESGLQVPMIVRYPDQERAGQVDDRLISFVDFAPTLLSMAGIQPPSYMQGKAFEGKFRSQDERAYIHAAADRFDETYDMIRAVRDSRFKYLRNFQTEKPYYLPLEYRENMASMQELLRMRDEGTLNKDQMQWFRSSKPEEELFDLKNDPQELNNLATDLKYQAKLDELREECTRWMASIEDKGLIPEMELIEMFWPNNNQPTTRSPNIMVKDGQMSLSCNTEGASIGYRFLEEHRLWLGWNCYQQPVDLPLNKTVEVVAHRIGYIPSDTLVVTIN